MAENEGFSQEDMHSNFPGAPTELREFAEGILNKLPIAGAVGVALGTASMATGIGEVALIGFGAYVAYKGVTNFVRHSMREKIFNDYEESLK